MVRGWNGEGFGAGFGGLDAILRHQRLRLREAGREAGGGDGSPRSMRAATARLREMSRSEHIEDDRDEVEHQ